MIMVYQAIYYWIGRLPEKPQVRNMGVQLGWNSPLIGLWDAGWLGVAACVTGRPEPGTLRQT